MIQYIVFIAELCAKFEYLRNNLNSKKTYLYIINDLK